MSEESGEDAALFETPVGTRLREARESQGISLEEIGKTTRIPLRQLQNIENSTYDKLPAPTYSIGFVKTYSATIGLDPKAMASDFREEINFHTTGETSREFFEPTDPARVPPRSLAWIATGIALFLVIAYALWRSGTFGLDGDDWGRLAAGTNPTAAEASEATAPQTPATGPAAPSADGAVVIEAVDPIGSPQTVINDVSLSAADLVQSRPVANQQPPSASYWRRVRQSI